MKTIFALAVLATVAFAQTSNSTEEELTPEEIQMEALIQGSKGFFQGFSQGLYRTQDINDDCLNKQAEDKIIELFDVIFYGPLDLSVLFSIITDFVTITSSMQNCGSKPVQDLFNHCLFKGGDGCSLTTIIANAQKNLFVIMGEFTDLSTLVLQGLPKNPEEAYNTAKQAGLDIGKMIRVLIGFNPNQ